MSKNDKADIIKEHAINGRFREIEEAYGTKAAMKGREYVSGVLRFWISLQHMVA